MPTCSTRRRPCTAPVQTCDRDTGGLFLGLRRPDTKAPLGEFSSRCFVSAVYDPVGEPRVDFKIAWHLVPLPRRRARTTAGGLAA